MSKYQNLNLLMRREDSEDMPNGVESEILLAIFAAATEEAKKHGLWIFSGGTKGEAQDE